MLFWANSSKVKYLRLKVIDKSYNLGIKRHNKVDIIKFNLDNVKFCFYQSFFKLMIEKLYYIL